MTTRARIAAALTAAGLPGVNAAHCRAGGGYWYFHGGEADRWRSQASPWRLTLTHDVADFVEAALALAAENADELADDDWHAVNDEGDIVVYDALPAHSPSDAWDIYVGDQTPAELLDGDTDVEGAIDDYVNASPMCADLDGAARAELGAQLTSYALAEVAG